jgi:hypothetical protein
MKDWIVTETEVSRKGEIIAQIADGHFFMAEGKKNFTNMVKKVLKQEGKESITEFSAVVRSSDLNPEVETVQVEPVTAEIPESVEDLPPVKPPQRKFELPRDCRLEYPPREKVHPIHKSTLYFNKNGRGVKLALDIVPDDEGILTIIQEFKHP